MAPKRTQRKTNPSPARKVSGLSSHAQQIASGLNEALEHAKGRGGARESLITVPEPPPDFPREKVTAVRRELRLTQVEFARLMNVSVKSVEGWEQGTRQPSGPTRRLLQIVQSPQVLNRLTGGKPAQQKAARRRRHTGKPAKKV